MAENNKSIYSALMNAVMNIAKEELHRRASVLCACLNEQIQKIGMELTSGKSRYYDPNSASEHEGNLIKSFPEIFYAKVIESGDGYEVSVVFPENMSMTNNVIDALDIAFSNAMKILEMTGGDTEDVD